MSDGAWPVVHQQATATALHHELAPSAATRLVRVAEVSAVALVLGSTQPEGDLTPGAAERIEVTRRRSGGGAVLVGPTGVVWVDVVVPAGDPLWLDDVGTSFGWLGDAWATALRRLGVAGAVVHRGPLQRTALSPKVCFAGVGPGEVLVGGHKVIGLSQRRTRAGAVFQCAALLEWEPGPLLDALSLDGPERSDLEALGDALAPLGPRSPDAVVSALLASLP